MELEASSSTSKKLIVLIVVLGGMAALAVAAVVLIRAQSGGSMAAGADGDTAAWCRLRREWEDRVKGMDGDIVLKQVTAPKEAEALEAKRNATCQEYAKKVRDLKVADPRARAVEEALLNEGMVRANISVEIYNVKARHLETGRVEDLRAGVAELEGKLQAHIAAAQKEADAAFAAAMAPISDCRGVHRGPLTDEGTSDNPFVSWGELEFKRTSAVKAFREKLDAARPYEELKNRVYHDLVAKYGKTLRTCHAKSKKRNPTLSDAMDLRVRLKGDGKVASLAIEKMENPEPKLLDCLLTSAGSWALPRPIRDNDFVVVAIDFSRL